MASTAGHISRDLLSFDFRRLVGACAPAGRLSGASPTLFAGEDLTARAVAIAGLAALFALPFLLLSSVMLAVPLAVPAAIGLGYLTMSHALAAQDFRRADYINAVVLCGLVGWLLLFMLAGEGPLSRGGLVAALMAPLFAAAPALARSLMARQRAQPKPTATVMRDTALDRVACLDELAPNEQVLVLDVEGTVLAATAAARRSLPLLPDAFEHHLSSLFEVNELPRLLNALDRCKAHAEWVDADLNVDLDTRGGLAEGRALTASVSLCGDGTVAMRLQESPCFEPRPIAARQAGALHSAASQSAKQASAPSCDIGEALAFALRHAEPKAAAKQIALTSTVEPGLGAACDRQIGRRILYHLIDSALNGSRGGGAVHVLARRLKGVVLLRVASEFGTDARGAGAELDDAINGTTLRALVESAGGTLIVDRDGHDIALSVRLNLAADRAAGMRVD